MISEVGSCLFLSVQHSVCARGKVPLKSTNVTPHAPHAPMKTTIAGILTILVTLGNAALSFINTGAFDVATAAAGIAAGYGLIKAQDAP